MSTITVKTEDERQAAMDQAAQVNFAYSLAGANATAEEAAKVGQVSLSMFDQAEMQKLYSAEEQGRFLERMQAEAQDAAARRVADLQRQAEARAAVVGGLAYTSTLDIGADTDLDDLPEDALLDLPWNLPILGPAKYGTVHVRKSWTEWEALEAACMLDWNVRVAPARWTTRDGHRSRSARRTHLIVRDPVQRYADRCRCADYHGRDGEAKTYTNREGKEVRKDPCPWTVEWDLGECRADWKADIQNEDLVAVLQAFAADGRFTPQSVLWLEGGTKVAIQMKLAETLFVLGDDPHGLYLSAENNFSGKGATKMIASGVRYRCRNTNLFGEATAVAMGRAAHVGDVKRAMEEVGKLALRAAGFMDQYAKDAEALARLELSLSDVKAVVDAVVPDSKRADFAKADLMGLVLADETVPEELRGKTGWGVMQSINRGLANPKDTRTATSRLTSVWAPDGKARLGTRKARQVIDKLATRKVQVVR